MKRQAITAAMKIRSLLLRYNIICSECGDRINSFAAIEWDHIHALVHGGDHDYTNIRPIHYGCHKAKTARDIAANAKVKRIRGETCNGPKRKIPSRPFVIGGKK